MVSSRQEAPVKNLCFTLDYKESPVVQWLEHPARLWRVMGSNSMWNSDFLQVDAISQLTFLKSIFIYFLFCFVFIIFLSFILFISFFEGPTESPHGELASLIKHYYYCYYYYNLFINLFLRLVTIPF